MEDMAVDGFADFARTRGSRLRRLAYLQLGDWHEAEDVTQTALAKIYAAWSRVSAADDPDAYATRVLVNACRSHHRRHRLRLALGPEPRHGVVGDGAAVRAQRDELVAALRRLPPGQRAVIALRFWEDLTEQATAAHLGISVGTVKSQTARALKALRQHGFTEEGAHERAN
jgi:RNA polymerase sigma-70 factor (sigma-E family)